MELAGGFGLVLTAGGVACLSAALLGAHRRWDRRRTITALAGWATILGVSLMLLGLGVALLILGPTRRNSAALALIVVGVLAMMRVVSLVPKVDANPGMIGLVGKAAASRRDMLGLGAIVVVVVTMMIVAVATVLGQREGP